MHKQIPFREHIVYPNSPEMLAITPTGKAPAMTTEKGTKLSESSVLVEYLEDAYPNTPLYPEDPDARAQVRQIIKISELYLELPARRLLPAVLGNATIHDSIKAEVRAALDRGTRCLQALTTFSPFLLGQELTLADIYLRYALSIPMMAGPEQLNWNVMDEVPGLTAWDEMMAATDIAQSIDADKKANTAEFMAAISAKSKP
jgi:glutathione S-transferase